MNVLDIFCGAGGFSFGMELTGIKTKIGVDIWKPALETFKRNHSYASVIQGNLFKMGAKDFYKIEKEIDCVIGGPPCQAFSTVGKRALNDERALLVKEFGRIVKEIRPQIFVFENVKGFASFAKGQLLREILDLFDSLGYEMDWGVLNAVNYGAPQNRERFIIIGSLGNKILLPEPTIEKRATFWEAVSDLPPLSAGEKADRYAKEPQNKLQKYYRRKELDVLTEHVAKNHSEKLLAMMQYIPEGKSAHEVDMPNELKPTSGYKNTYKRIRNDEPSPTITRNFCVPSSSNCIHPKQNRALTLREAARLQTFPDDFEFYGNDVEKRIQVGNAVPPFLGKAIGNAILNALR